jgi:hypothetical protein
VHSNDAGLFGSPEPGSAGLARFEIEEHAPDAIQFFDTIYSRRRGAR